MNTSFLRIKKAVAAFALGSLLATFAATPIALADSTPDWARGDDMGVGATQANRCEALAIALLNAGYASTEADAEAASNFEDIEGQCQQDVGLGVQLGAINAEGKTEYNGDALVQRTEYVLMITRLLQDEMDARILAGEEVADLSEAHTAELEASTHSGWDTKVFSTDAEGNEVELDMFQVWARSIHFDLIKGENNGEFLNPEGALNGYQASTVADRAAESFELTEEYSSASTETEGPDDSEETTEEETTEEETTEVEAEGGDLTVSLSNNSPESAQLYSSNNAGGKDTTTPVVAMFQVSASDEAVMLSGLEFKVNQTVDVVNELAVFSTENVRLSRAKGINSDNEATVNLLDDITIQPNDSVQLAVRASLKKQTEGSFNVELLSASSNAASTDLSDVVSARHDVDQADVALITITGDNAPEVSVGEQSKKVYDFEFDVTQKDATVSALTFKEAGSANLSDLANLALYMESEMVAEGVVNGDYVTFNFNSPMTFDEDVTDYDGYIMADILDGAGEGVNFEIESALDVEGSSENVPYGIEVDASSSKAGTNTSITSGEIVVVPLAPVNDETTSNRDDVILAEMSITPNSGKDIEIQELRFDIADVTNSREPEDFLENPVVYVSKVRGGMSNSEDLAIENAGDLLDAANGAAAANADHSSRLVNDSVNYSLKQGTTYYLTVRSDLKDAANAADLDLEVTISGIGGASGADATGMYVEADNDALTDITPNALTFDSIDVIEASLDASPKAQANEDVIVGRTINAFHFELEASNASDITVKDLDFEFKVNGAAATDSTITNVELYVDEVSGSPLKYSSDFANGIISFDGLELTIAADETKEFFVYVTVLDDDSLAGDVIKTFLKDESLFKDDKKKTIAIAADVESDRDLTISAGGSIEAEIDKNAEGLDLDHYMLSGSTKTVAAIELTAQDEDIEIKDFEITIDDETGVVNTDSEANQLFDRVIILDSEMVEITSKNVDSLVTTFDNESINVEKGSEYIYIQLVANNIGEGQTGYQTASKLSVNFEITEAKGQNILGAAALGTASGKSNYFDVIPVHAASASFVQSAGNTQVTSELDQDEQNLAILAVTAGSHTATDLEDGGSVDLQVSQLKLDVAKLATTKLKNLTVKKANSSQTAVQGYNLAPGATVQYTAVEGENKITINAVTYTEPDDANNLVGAAGGEAEGLAAQLNNVAGIGAAAAGAVVTITAGNSGLWIETLAVDGGSYNDSANVTSYATFDLSSAGDYNKIGAGETSHFVFRGDVELDADADTKDYVKLDMSSTDSSQIKYASEGLAANLAANETITLTTVALTAASININGFKFTGNADPNADVVCTNLRDDINDAADNGIAGLAACGANGAANNILSLTGTAVRVDLRSNIGFDFTDATAITLDALYYVTDLRLPGNAIDNSSVKVN